MIRVDLSEAEVGSLRLLRAARAGEAVVFCDRDEPVAESRALPTLHYHACNLGPERPGFEIPVGFFEPLTDDFG